MCWWVCVFQAKEGTFYPEELWRSPGWPGKHDRQVKQFVSIFSGCSPEWKWLDDTQRYVACLWSTFCNKQGLSVLGGIVFWVNVRHEFCIWPPFALADAVKKVVTFWRTVKALYALWLSESMMFHTAFIWSVMKITIALCPQGEKERGSSTFLTGLEITCFCDLSEPSLLIFFKGGADSSLILAFPPCRPVITTSLFQTDSVVSDL